MNLLFQKPVARHGRATGAEGGRREGLLSDFGFTQF